MNAQLQAELRKIDLARLRFVMRAEESLELYGSWGVMLRGAFGTILKNAVCSMEHRDCSCCIYRNHCPYSVLFESTAVEPSATGNLISIARPYVLRPMAGFSDQTHRLAAGERFHFDMVLIGRAISLFQYIIQTIHDVTELGGKSVRLVAVVDEASKRLLFDSDGPYHTTLPQPVVLALDEDAASAAGLKLTFKSPLRILSNGRAMAAPSFADIIGSSLRRVYELSKNHCGTYIRLDYQEFIKAASQVVEHKRNFHWVNQDRTSGRQNTVIPIGGIVGSTCYDKKAVRFLPLLRLAEAIHIGDDVVLGMGQVNVQVTDAAVRADRRSNHSTFVERTT